MSTNAWTLVRDETSGLARLTLDVPNRPVNTLSVAVLEELSGVLDQLEAKPPKGLTIRSGKKAGFIAGADVKEFTTLNSMEAALAMIRRGQQQCDRIAALPCPSVALLQGHALGGGLELALACTYRVGVEDGRLALGLPEVQLGIHPGFGGSIRSVRTVGMKWAMEAMLTGKTVRGDKALRQGWVDRLVNPAEAESVCQELLLQKPPARQPGLTERAMSWPLVRSVLAPRLRAEVRRKARPDHYPAPYAIIDLWERYGAQGRAVYNAEAESIARLFQSSTARNLVRVFLLQDRLKSLGSGGATTQDIKHVHVVGAGVMGGDIAAWCAVRGFTVTLQDRSEELLRPAMARAAELFAKRLFTHADREAAQARLKADVAGDGAAQCQLAIEAIFENREAKQALYSALEPKLSAQAVLGSNTSSLVLEALATQLLRPEQFVGLHFFNPVPQMPLVEIVVGEKTAPAVVAAASAFVKRLDKLPLPCRSSPGFLVNRVLIPYLQEGMLAVEEGFAPETVDAVALEFGMPMGPVELADVVGLDVCKHVGEIIGQALGRTPPRRLERFEALVANKQLGRKTGQGFYPWIDGKAQKQATVSANTATAASTHTTSAELSDRLMLTLVNECVACLREGIVADADLVDAGMIFGAGFAPFRGGPLNWARDAGPEKLRARLQSLALQHGSRFEPDAGWSLLGAAATIQ